MIGGDGLVMSIAAASIIAKVTRDRLMCALAQDCPGYGFESHKGYGVPEHLEALNRLGPTAHHRRLFAPVVAAREKHEAIAVAGHPAQRRRQRLAKKRRAIPRSGKQARQPDRRHDEHE